MTARRLYSCNLFIPFLLFAFLFISLPSSAIASHSEIISLPDSLTMISDTSLALERKSRKEIRNQRRELSKKELKESHNRFLIEGAYVFAHLDTKVVFNLPNGMVKLVVGLEQDLGLPRSSAFFSGSCIARITPGSGIYFNYYGFNRSRHNSLKKDIFWGGDTIHADVEADIYFKTQVISAGYILSILRKPDSFLGAYLNFYVMPLSIGINTNSQFKNASLKVVAPLPNIGLVAVFSLTKWLYVYGNVGFFSIYTDFWGGYLQDLNLALKVRTTKWLSFSIKYQKFMVNASFPNEEIDTHVIYDFQGPAVGVVLNF